MNSRMRMRYTDYPWGPNKNNKLIQWSTTLSFKSLKNAKLVSCYNEYTSIKVAFYYKNTDAKFIIKWLKQQKRNFRISYLSHILIDGYTKTCVKNAVMDIGNIIMAYCNITFIKFYENGSNNKYTIRVFDANFSINNLTEILKSENSNNQIRIWSRFNAIKWIYSEEKDANFDDKKNNRWVQIPTNKCKDLTIAEIDNKLPYHKTLEFGTDKLDKVCYDRNITCIYGWTFMETLPTSVSNDNRLDWLCSLSKGDIIDVFYGMKWNEAYILNRDYDTFYFRFINDYSNNVYRIKSIGVDLNRLQRRYTHCTYSVNPLCNNNYFDNTQFNKFVNCTWITAFAGNSMYYPILIE